MDIAVLMTPEALISLVTLTFLEIVLGVDNIVFITITSNKLPQEKQHIGRKLGLAGALISRCVFLCFASYLVHLVNPIFFIPLGAEPHPVSVRDLILFLGGAYLIYKGIAEVRSILALDEEHDQLEHEQHGENAAEHVKRIGLGQAVGTIMVMDVVFSIDSVITAVGLAEHLIVMILAVLIAIVLMMVFIDQIADFINAHTEMKILALVFITVIGILLVLDGAGINSHIEVLGMHAEKVMVYFAMIFAFVLELIQMRYNSNLKRFQDDVRASVGDED
ncbi:MAG: TerC family protein [Coriobacteriales bacterium]